jgi:hypothetical protein
MDKRNKKSNKTAYQKRIFGVPFAVLKSVTKYRTAFLQFLSTNTFINKELEIIFANIRV